ncbi:MAG: methylmalonyl Co-A mutase-associated GTPase MeaB [Proteobacteria bacterium]|nr:methylmalonyl Co-A mutase-associated GTPase MeaB [Pseudomonadota bacterium]
MGPAKYQTVGEFAEAIRAGKRSALARGITLVESRRADHQKQAQELLLALGRKGSDSIRVGITGVPGVGKSTFIEAVGTRLTGQGHKVAVLAVDPTSSRTGGSILGDKTRMVGLANNPDAFVRPSPTSGKLGGVTATTREAMILCEAAGYDVILVETVGTGQSEIQVADMVDFFLLLVLPGAGDELQGIKKGVLELAHMVAVNKAEDDRSLLAKQAVRELKSALKMLVPLNADWQPPVRTCSAINDEGLDTLWEDIEKFASLAKASGAFEEKRKTQTVRWMWDRIEDRLLSDLKTADVVSKLAPDLEARVMEGRTTPALAADRLLEVFYQSQN